jgi:hypothetical protein
MRQGTGSGVGKPQRRSSPTPPEESLGGTLSPGPQFIGVRDQGEWGNPHAAAARSTPREGCGERRKIGEALSNLASLQHAWIRGAGPETPLSPLEEAGRIEGATDPASGAGGPIEVSVRPPDRLEPSGGSRRIVAAKNWRWDGWMSDRREWTQRLRHCHISPRRQPSSSVPARPSAPRGACRLEERTGSGTVWRTSRENGMLTACVHGCIVVVYTGGQPCETPAPPIGQSGASR